MRRSSPTTSILCVFIQHFKNTRVLVFVSPSPAPTPSTSAYFLKSIVGDVNVVFPVPLPRNCNALYPSGVVVYVGAGQFAYVQSPKSPVTDAFGHDSLVTIRSVIIDVPSMSPVINKSPF